MIRLRKIEHVSARKTRARPGIGRQMECNWSAGKQEAGMSVECLLELQSWAHEWAVECRSQRGREVVWERIAKLFDELEENADARIWAKAGRA